MSTQTRDNDSDSIDEKPANGKEAILRVLTSDDELLEAALSSETGYPRRAVEEMARRWGQEMVPSSGEAYVCNIVSKHKDELTDAFEGEIDSVSPKKSDSHTASEEFKNDILEMLVEEGAELTVQEIAEHLGRSRQHTQCALNELLENDRVERDESTEPYMYSPVDDESVTVESTGTAETSIAELESTEADDSPPTNGSDRAKHIILENDDLQEGAMEKNPDPQWVEEVIDAVVEEYGMLYRPTRDSVRKAAHELRQQNELVVPVDNIDTGEPAELWYVCELCGEDRRTYQAIKDHIADTDDGLHGSRTAKDTHLIGLRSEAIEATHHAFGNAEFKEELDDGFDVIWSIHQNPGARQKDIAKLLDISPETLSRRLSDLGIDWDNREEDVQELIDEWMGEDEEEGEIVERKLGNRSFTGRSDYTLPGGSNVDRSPQTIAEARERNPELFGQVDDADTLSIEIPPETAIAYLCGDDDALKRLVLREVLQTVDPDDL